MSYGRGDQVGQLTDSGFDFRFRVPVLPGRLKAEARVPLGPTSLRPAAEFASARCMPQAGPVVAGVVIDFVAWPAPGEGGRSHAYP